MLDVSVFISIMDGWMDAYKGGMYIENREYRIQNRE